MGYFDLGIINYVVLYGYLSDEFMAGKIVIGNIKYNAKCNLSFLILLPAMIYDLIVLRNLALVGFDSQYHSISRNFIEKVKSFVYVFMIRIFLSTLQNIMSVRMRYYTRILLGDYNSFSSLYFLIFNYTTIEIIGGYNKEEYNNETCCIKNNAPRIIY